MSDSESDGRRQHGSYLWRNAPHTSKQGTNSGIHQNSSSLRPSRSPLGFMNPRHAICTGANRVISSLSVPPLSGSEVRSTCESMRLPQELVDAIFGRKPLAEIKALIAAGAPVWYQDDEGTSPLHAAAYVEDQDLIRFLVAEGALWNAGMTACCPREGAQS